MHFYDILTAKSDSYYYFENKVHNTTHISIKVTFTYGRLTDA